MILLVHMLFGAAVGSTVNNIPLAIILAFLSHYFLDLFPHIEYGVDNITKKQWQKALPDILKVFLDFLVGILLVALFYNGRPIIFAYAFCAIIPDGLTVLSILFPHKIFKAHDKFHLEKTHFLRHKKISGVPVSGPWRILSQVMAVAVAILLLKI